MLRVLHIEGSAQDAVSIQRALGHHGIHTDFKIAKTQPDFFAALEQGDFDLVLTDGGLPGVAQQEVFKSVRERFPSVGLICISDTGPEKIPAGTSPGPTDWVGRDDIGRLAASIRREQERLRLVRMNQSMSRLVATVQELSLVRDLNAIMAIVRHAARELTGADGASFVLRDGDQCHYADEEAIAPLWKGQKFPMKICASGWVMLHRQPAVIEDIYADPRIPAEAYRPTFVKSLALVPIRTAAPIGVIGNYWATRHQPTEEEVGLLQALANTTAVAMENVQVYDELERRVKDRTTRLEIANQELDSFSHAVSHDLGAPLRSISGFAQLALKECNGNLSEKGRHYLTTVQSSAVQMRELMDDLLRLSKVSRSELVRGQVDLSSLAREIIRDLELNAPERRVQVQIADGLVTDGDPGLLCIVLQNLLSNAWKYTSKCPQARIEFGTTPDANGVPAFFVRDNGAGFDMEFAQKLFQPFQRLHRQDEFPGTGIGLTTVQRIIHRHGGRIWAEASPNQGAAFYFTVNGAHPA